MNRSKSVFGLSLLAATCGLVFATRPVHAQVIEDAPEVALTPVVIGPKLPSAALLAASNISANRMVGGQNLASRLASNGVGGFPYDVIGPQTMIIGPVGGTYPGPRDLLNASGTWWNEAGQAAGRGSVEGAVSGAVAGAVACGPVGAAEGAGVGAVAGAAAGFMTYALSSGLPGMPGPIVINPMTRLD